MKIIYEDASGRVCVVHPAPQNKVALLLPEVAAMTATEYVTFVRNRDVPADAKNVHVVAATDIPQDRTNRDRWKIVNGRLVP